MLEIEKLKTTNIKSSNERFKKVIMGMSTFQKKKRTKTHC